MKYATYINRADETDGFVVKPNTCHRCSIKLEKANTHLGRPDQLCDDCVEELETGRMNLGAERELIGTSFNFVAPDYLRGVSTTW